jgi:guanylate kinase
MAGLLFIISAPSGSGKSTLVTQLRTLVEGLDFSVSYTTRAPRGSEEDGREYHFTTREEFEDMIARGEFMEWAEVFGNYYGTAVAALKHAERLGKDLLLDIDVQGAKQVMQKLPSAISIFILSPSPRVLEMRLRNRSEAEGVACANVISEADLEKRLAEAKNEVKQIRKYKYALVNDVLDQAVAEMRAIVLCERGVLDGVQAIASSCRTDAASPRLRAALDTFDVGA